MGSNVVLRELEDLWLLYAENWANNVSGYLWWLRRGEDYLLSICMTRCENVGEIGGERGEIVREEIPQLFFRKQLFEENYPRKGGII